MKKYLIVILALHLSGCVCVALLSEFTCDNKYVDPGRANMRYTSYIYKTTLKTQSGIQVDLSGQEVDLAKIDIMVSDLENCLHISISRCGFRVKIAPDWKFQECAGGQTFPCKDPTFPAGCESLPCSCGCYGVVEYPSTVVTTPDLKSFKHELIHVVTHTTHKDGEKSLANLAPVFKCQVDS
jgi:hypothetical protein